MIFEKPENRVAPEPPEPQALVDAMFEEPVVCHPGLRARQPWSLDRG